MTSFFLQRYICRISTKELIRFWKIIKAMKHSLKRNSEGGSFPGISVDINEK